MKTFEFAAFSAGFVLLMGACATEDGGPHIDEPSPSAGTSGQLGLGGLGVGGSSAGVAGSGIAFGGTIGTAGAVGSGGSCASESASAKVLPVYLAFAFDVSGSMGLGDFPWHDRSLKWDPVVAATKAFFEDPASQGLTASMTFFPAADDKCEDESYATPVVPLTPLPSPVFGTALDTMGSQSWRGGTPTLHVLRGVVGAVERQKQMAPGRYVIVLVTDGYPQSCDDNSIDSVAAVVAGVAAEIPTYVVGVKNPPLPEAPDTVTNLNQVAVAGRTDHAYIIDTGNPTQTAAAFKATIDAIRGAAISCDISIPAPPGGRVFDKQKVIVSYRSGTMTTALAYDANCAGSNAWRYDDPMNPTQIELCASSCAAIQADPQANLSVEFTCEPQISIPR